MNCQKCGAKIEGNVKYCAFCGTPNNNQASIISNKVEEVIAKTESSNSAISVQQNLDNACYIKFGSYTIKIIACKIGLLDSNNMEITPCLYDKMEVKYKFKSTAIDYIIWKKDDKYIFTNKTGKRFDSPPFDGFVFLNYSNLLVFIGEKYGIVNLTEEHLLCEMRFSLIKSIASCKSYGLYFAKGNSGNEIIALTFINNMHTCKYYKVDFEFIMSAYCITNAFWCRQNNTIRLAVFYNDEIMYISQIFSDYCGGHGNSEMFLKQHSKWGLFNYSKIEKDKDLNIDLHGINAIEYQLSKIDYKYSDICKIPMGLRSDYAYKKSENWGFLNDNGKETDVEIFDRILGVIHIHRSLIIFGEINKIIVAYLPKVIKYPYDLSGNNLIDSHLVELEYEDIKILYNNLFAYKIKSMWGLASFELNPTSDDLFNHQITIKNFVTICPNRYNDITMMFTSLDYYYISLKMFGLTTVVCFKLYADVKIISKIDFTNELEYFKPNYPFFETVTFAQKINNQIKYCIRDNILRSLSDEMFDDLININSINYIIFKIGNKTGLISRMGDILIEPQFDEIVRVGNTVCYIENHRMHKFVGLDDNFLLCDLYPKSKKITKSEGVININEERNINNNFATTIDLVGYECDKLIFLRSNGHFEYISLHEYPQLAQGTFSELSTFEINELTLEYKDEYDTYIKWTIVYSPEDDEVNFKNYETYLDRDEEGIYCEKSKKSKFVISAISEKLKLVDFMYRYIPLSYKPDYDYYDDDDDDDDDDSW